MNRLKKYKKKDRNTNRNSIIEKTKNNRTKIFIKSKIHFKIIIYYFIIYCLLNISIQEDLNLSSYSKIILTIKGGGDQLILSDYSNFTSEGMIINQFNSTPDEIYVNGNIQNITGKKVYNLDDQLNNITLIWKYPLTDCGAMFYNLSNITAIDLSNLMIIVH